MHIDIAGKSKSAVLRALFNHSRQQGLDLTLGIACKAWLAGKGCKS